MKCANCGAPLPAGISPEAMDRFRYASAPIVAVSTCEYCGVDHYASTKVYPFDRIDARRPVSTGVPSSGSKVRR